MSHTSSVRAWWVSFGLAAALMGCGSTLQAGLASAPGGTRSWTEADLAQEPIANSHRSCSLEPGKPDPLPNRFPPCAEASAAGRGNGRNPAAVSR
ncbi:MAG: hypothetical protein EOO75_00145 [Myxococcales bacterium]|nr:MAG: hypothetical protein EOO75_00145 [Myxococcales bacterium]